ncbi:hypothetical protein KQI63_16275 [bacterium]|nr:hypothetical protein [bacterium]
MLNRLTGLVVTALLLVSSAFGAPEEVLPSSGLTISGQFGVFSITGTGSATPGAWDTKTGSIPFNVTEDALPSLVRQEPASRLGFGWDSNSLAVFGLGIGYRFNDRLFASVNAEWANNREYDSYNEYYYDDAPGIPSGLYEYLDESDWIQASLALSAEYAPFQKRPNIFLTAGLIYTRFVKEMEYVQSGWYEDEYVSNRRMYDDVGGAFGYSLGAGYLFARKAGSREAFLLGTWTYMPYGTPLGFSDDARFFNRRMEIQLGGFRLTTGIRFFVSQIL